MNSASQTRRNAGRAHAALGVATALALLVAACSDDGDSSSQPEPTLRPTTQATITTSEATLKGSLTLDGSALEADFLGVSVVRDGLVAACQNQIPPVALGYYDIPVASESEVKGCGAEGAELLLWAYVDGTYLFSTQAAPWPGEGETATFDASFSSADPAGASKPVTGFKGLLFDAQGQPLPEGTVVEAYAGDALCGVTSLRPIEATEGFYTLIVAGPESVPGCAVGATLTFRLDGQAAVETATNDLASGATGHELNLTLQ